MNPRTATFSVERFLVRSNQEWVYRHQVLFQIIEESWPRDILLVSKTYVKHYKMSVIFSYYYFIFQTLSNPRVTIRVNTYWQFNIFFCWNFTHIFYWTMSTKACSGFFLILFRSWVINKNVKKRGCRNQVF